MIRNLVDRAVSLQGSGAFDAVLGPFQATSQIINQVYQQVANASTRGTARATVASMKRCFGINVFGRPAVRSDSRVGQKHHRRDSLFYHYPY